MIRKKILIVNVNWLGDVLFSTPFVRTLRQRYPESHIATLIHPRCKAMVANNPRINEVILYDEEGRHRSLAGKVELILKLRRKKFDVAFILHRSFTKALITFLSGIKERIGYATKGREKLLTGIAEEPAEELHKVDYFLNVIDSFTTENAAMNRRDRRDGYEFFPSSSDDRFITDRLAQKGLTRGERFVVINPGGNWGPKRWPKEDFAKAADGLCEKYNAKIIITGANKDARLAQEIKRLMKRTPVIMAGETTLGQLGALLKRAALVIANDSGPMHIAVAMKTKVIALFGPTSPALTGPYGTGAYRVLFNNKECAVPCYDVACRDNRCMRAISVGDVLSAAEALMEKE